MMLGLWASSDGEECLPTDTFCLKSKEVFGFEQGPFFTY